MFPGVRKRVHWDQIWLSPRHDEKLNQFITLQSKK